jgi:pyrimidine-nucleoside phosphorylase
MNFKEVYQNIEKNILVEDILDNLLGCQNILVEEREQFLSAFCQIILKNQFKKQIVKLRLEEISNLNIKIQVKMLLETINNPESQKNIIYHKLYYREELKEDEIQSIVNMSLKGKLHSLELTVVLNLIKYRGLSADNVSTLSLKMAQSGKIFDYRNIHELNSKKIIRRYPTGGVSEKIALIMPSLLKCLAKRLNFTSPFLVAKTLGFTGGTWDKLKSIPDFHFPNAGYDSINILKKNNVCMTVAKGDYNPSDTFLYQLRSITNTVDSLPLIISSVASKQIANPVDTLLLDIRYGENAFLPNLATANAFYKQIKIILKNYNIVTIAEFVNTQELHGVSIGNYQEVIESICIMRNETSYDTYSFDCDLIKQQKELVILMTSKLISNQFQLEIDEVKKLCIDFFTNLDVFNAFKEILISHNVRIETISKIENRNHFGAAAVIKEFPIFSHKTGIIEEIKQKNIGNFVNFNLKAGSNTFNPENNFYDGIILKKKLLSKVNKNEVIASIFSRTDIDTRSLSNIFFKIN